MRRPAPTALASLETLLETKRGKVLHTRVTSRHYAHLAARTLADAVTRLLSFGAMPMEKAVAIR
jgi:hypothetical protein